ncbi:MAG: hypothetical protein SVR94_19710 [Pseudomonadota bacterium]|nr:hypothetical protein [Pseudomonadota bacterium]
MKRLSYSLIFMIMSIYTLPNWAATVIKRENLQGETEKVILDQEHVRIEYPDTERYMIFDMGKQKAYAINKKEKMIVEMAFTAPTPPRSAQSPRQRAKRPVEAELVKKGEGPKIAGYSTLHYQLTAHGKPCSDEYFSNQATEIENIKAFLTAMNELSQSRQPPAIPMHPCQQAHNELTQKAFSIGVPMKSATAKGKIRHEIKSIETGVKVDATQFTLPKEYQLKTEQQMITEAQQRMDEHSARRPPPRPEYRSDYPPPPRSDYPPPAEHRPEYRPY